MGLDDLYQEIILEHYKSPKNRGSLKEPDATAEGHNPFCGDEISLSLQLKDGHVHDIAFNGSGCAISQASASVMTEAVKGKSVAKVRELFDKFSQMIKNGEITDVDEMEELAAFQGVSEFPTRVKCAMLAWNALKDGLEKTGEEKDE